MPTLSEIFDKRKIFLYQNESLDLDHYYQEPYQDENDEIKEMGRPFETNESKKFRTFDLVKGERFDLYKKRDPVHARTCMGSLLLTRISRRCVVWLLRLNCFIPVSDPPPHFQLPGGGYCFR